MAQRPAARNFLGIDLAWSDRNPSGLAQITYDRRAAVVADIGYAASDDGILRWVDAHSAPTTWIGVDGPIIAPNPAGTSREADKIVTSLFGRYHAGVYPGNRERCARPIRLCRKLMAQGYSPDPSLPSRNGKRQLEVFPHLAQIVLFGPRRIIKYKKGGREKKRRGLATLQRAIESLSHQHPPLGPSAILRALIRGDPRELRGRALKGLEDRLDAVLCAYMTLYFWYWRERKCSVYGDVTGGYIIGPKCGRQG